MIWCISILDGEEYIMINMLDRVHNSEKDSEIGT
jgi:hypothetical protein